MTDLARVEHLEWSGRVALPALKQVEVGDWIIRISGGATKRVNSVNPVRAGAALQQVRVEAERLYAQSDLPCRFRLTPLADRAMDGTLADLGYETVDRSLTMAARLDVWKIHPSVNIVEQLDEAWVQSNQALQERSHTATAIQIQLLANMPPPSAFASIESDGAIVASAYASIGNGRAQISDVIVAPNVRGHGLGHDLVQSLMGWAGSQGCDEAMLQVLEDNIVARNLYLSLGFVDAYPYHYRIRR